MELERLFTWICFFFCLGLSATGLLAFFKEKRHPGFKPFLLLQYFLILIYAFGFYSIWSGIFYRLIFGGSSGSEKISGVPSFIILLGTPFLLIGLSILVLWASSLSKKKPSTVIYSGGVISTSLVIMLFFSLQDFDWRLNIQQLYALLYVTVIFLSCLFLSFSSVNYLNASKKRWLILLLLLAGFIHLPLFFFTGIPAFEPAFAFLFFLTNTAFCLFFIYSLRPHLNKEERPIALSFDIFLQKYGITPRESEIIMEIYSGKTNKEIAEKLFVALQTVKDHTSRIYQKTNVKNRTQLVSVLRKFQ